MQDIILSNLLHAVSYLICMVLYEASSITTVFQMSFLRGREVKSQIGREESVSGCFKNIRASSKLT